MSNMDYNKGEIGEPILQFCELSADEAIKEIKNYVETEKIKQQAPSSLRESVIIRPAVLRFVKARRDFTYSICL